MMEPLRPLALAAAISVTLGVGVTTAQTVVVRNAAPGSAIELVFNQATVGAAKASPTGEATFPSARPASAGTADTDASVFVDRCADLWRVVVVERNQDPLPAGGGCERVQAIPLFLLRPATSFVVDVGGPVPRVWLRQGPVPAEWLRDLEVGAPARTWRPAPTGLVVFGAAGVESFREVIGLACGSAAECGGDRSPLNFTAGAEFWLTRFLSAEFTYLKPRRVTAKGDGGFYRFTSTLDADILTVAAKAGVPIGPVRFYGKFGGTYHWAIYETEQTVDDTSFTVDDVIYALPGGTQSYGLKTTGLSWMWGGGGEFWVSRFFAFYGEFGHGAIKGKAAINVDALTDDRTTYAVGGIRFHIGR